MKRFITWDELTEEEQDIMLELGAEESSYDEFPPEDDDDEDMGPVIASCVATYGPDGKIIKKEFSFDREN